MLLRPQQGLVGVGEAHAAEVRHGVALNEDNVVEKPEIKILKYCPYTINIMVGSDHPDRAGVFEQPTARRKPIVREAVVCREVVEAIPGVVDRVDLGHIGAPEILLKLEVVGRVGEDQIDRFFGQLVEDLDTVALEDLAKRESWSLHAGDSSFHHRMNSMPYTVNVLKHVVYAQ